MVSHRGTRFLLKIHLGDVDIKSWPGLALAEGRSCSSFKSSGPYGSESIQGVWNDEKRWRRRGDLSNIFFKAGKIQDYDVITYIWVGPNQRADEEIHTYVL